jgi:hypothetical protein
MKNLKLILPFLLLHAVQVAAQRPLTPADTNYIRKQAFQYVRVFKNTMERLGSTNNLSERQENIMIKFVLSYFRKGAKIEVTSDGESTREYDVDRYFSDIVANYSKRYSLVITTINISSFNISDLVPAARDANGNITAYKGTFSFKQGFCAKKNKLDQEKFNSADPNNYDVCETTDKMGEIYIEKKYSPTAGDRWVILLGNITVEKGKFKNLKSQ